MQSSRTLAASVLLLAAAALLSAPAASAATVTVHLQNALFAPAAITINPGDTVEFVNDDSFSHDVTFQAGFGSGAMGGLASGARWNHTFDTAGTFKYRCQVHSSNFDTGMVGTVTVGTPAAPPPAPKSPGFELLGALAAVGLVAILGARMRRA